MIVLIAFVVISLFKGTIIYLENSNRFNPPDPYVTCYYCQYTGHVRFRQEKRKAGISGAKATGAILTGGASLLVTGLSRRESYAVGKCGHCKKSATY